MDNLITILISHDSQDEAIACEIKSFLEDIFLSVNFFVSGRDLVGGQTWIAEIKDRLKVSPIIISIITKKSLDNKWLYFESGAGFTNDKTIPLLVDNIGFKDLNPPLNLLQARVFTESGIIAFINDISGKLGLREPQKNYSNIKMLINKVEKVLRNHNVLELKALLLNDKVVRNIDPWIYKDNCLVYDYIIDNKHKIAVDTYFQSDGCEIQLFGRDESEDYALKVMFKDDGFLPDSLNQYEMKNTRLIFKRFNNNYKMESVRDTLADILNRIEKYKNKVEL